MKTPKCPIVLVEEWRPTLFGYEASSFGRIRNPKSKRILAPGNNRGYQGVTLMGDDGKRRTTSVHKAVAHAFIGPRPTGFHINHIDGVKDNNAPSNLEYVTCRENVQHARRTGLAPNEANRRLTDEQIDWIRTKWDGKYSSARKAAREMGVWYTTFWAVASGLSWGGSAKKTKKYNSTGRKKYVNGRLPEQPVVPEKDRLPGQRYCQLGHHIYGENLFRRKVGSRCLACKRNLNREHSARKSLIEREGLAAHTRILPPEKL